MRDSFGARDGGWKKATPLVMSADAVEWVEDEEMVGAFIAT